MESCSFTHSIVTDFGVEFSPRKLETFVLANCSQISGESIKKLPPQLKNLEIVLCIKGFAYTYKFYALVPEEAMKFLPSSITSLAIGFLSFSDDVLKVIVNTCKNLKEIDISYCKFISDEAMKQLPPSVHVIRKKLP